MIEQMFTAFSPTGTRDVEGRAVLLLCAHNSAWNHPKCNSHELVRLLLYLQSIPRLGEEVGGQNLSQEMVGLGK